MSTVALAIGLVVGNLLHPGAGLQLTEDTAVGRTGGRPRRATAAPRSSCSGSSPTRCSPRSPPARCSRRCWSPCSSASRCRRWARPASRSCAVSATCQRLVFRVLSMIMWAAPVGAFGAIAAVVGETGVDALKSLAVLMVGFYVTCSCSSSSSSGRCSRWPPASTSSAVPLPGPGVPADPLDVVLGVGAAAADREDGARRRRQGDRRRRRADRLLVQPRRHRDLPDDGVAVHRRGAGRPAVASASRSPCCCS